MYPIECHILPRYLIHVYIKCVPVLLSYLASVPFLSTRSFAPVVSLYTSLSSALRCQTASTIMMDKVDSPMMDKVDSPASNGSDKSERGVITTPILTEEDDELDRHIASMTPEEYTRAERKMKIKMDLQVITLSGVLYLLSFLDRTK